MIILVKFNGIFCLCFWVQTMDKISTRYTRDTRERIVSAELRTSCSNCNGLLVHPICLPCGHLIDVACFTCLRNSQDSRCPSCGVGLPEQPPSVRKMVLSVTGVVDQQQEAV